MSQGRITRADHDQLAQIANAFAQEGDENARAMSALAMRIDVLRGGDWVGQNAAAFYKEADTSLMPAFKRLIEALRLAAKITREISVDVRRTEEAIALTLRQDEELSGGNSDTGGDVVSGGAEAPASGGGGGSGLPPMVEAPSGKGLLERLWNFGKERFLPQVERLNFDVDIFERKWDIELKLKWPPDLKVDLEHRGLLERMGIQPSPLMAANIDTTLGAILGPPGSVLSSALLGVRTSIEFGGGSMGIGSKGMVAPTGQVSQLTGANFEASGLTVSHQTIVGDKDFAYTSSNQLKLGLFGVEFGITEKGPGTSVDAQLIEVKQTRGFNYDGKNYSLFGKFGVGFSEGLMVGKDGVSFTKQLPTKVPLNAGGGFTLGDAVGPVSLSPGNNVGLTITRSPAVRAWYDLLGLPVPVEQWRQEY